jgi:hypothetical protein
VNEGETAGKRRVGDERAEKWADAYSFLGGWTPLNALTIWLAQKAVNV